MQTGDSRSGSEEVREALSLPGAPGGVHPQATGAEQTALEAGRRWEKRRRHWTELRAVEGSWSGIGPKRLPAFWLHPETGAHKHRAGGARPDSLPEALATQTVAWKTTRQATPVRFSVPRVLPHRGELLGTLSREKRRCGDPSCRCTSGREEDAHGPYVYRRFRDGSGALRRSYVSAEDVEAAQSGIQARCRRVQWQRERRTRYLEEARPSGGPSIQDVISGDATAERFAAEGNPAEAFTRRLANGGVPRGG
jgi:hypothetical protein